MRGVLLIFWSVLLINLLATDADELEAATAAPELEATTAAPEQKATTDTLEPKATTAAPEQEATAAAPEQEATTAAPKPGDSKCKPTKEKLYFAPFFGSQSLFSAKCVGGCFHFKTVNHLCNAREIKMEGLAKVKELCEGKESCEFTPIPLLPREMKCSGKTKAFINYFCVNGKHSQAHKMGTWE